MKATEEASIDVVGRKSEALSANFVGARHQRIGYMAGEITVPDDFGWLGGAKIEQLFVGPAARRST